MADAAVTVEIALTDEDYRRLAALLQARGWREPEGFGWLVAEGLSHYVRDQQIWTASPEGPMAWELQRREARAHLLLMRTRAAEAEARMAALRATVATLSPRYRQLRTALVALQRERQVLRAVPSAAPDLRPRRAGWGVRLWNLLLRRRWRR
jgi:hypothetical protein